MTSEDSSHNQHRSPLYPRRLSLQLIFASKNNRIHAHTYISEKVGKGQRLMGVAGRQGIGDERFSGQGYDNNHQH